MRSRSLDGVTTWVVPTAPCVSGGIVVPLRNSPGKVVVGPWDGPVAEGTGFSGVRNAAGLTGTPYRQSGRSPGTVMALSSPTSEKEGASASCRATAATLIGKARSIGRCVGVMVWPPCEVRALLALGIGNRAKAIPARIKVTLRTNRRIVLIGFSSWSGKTGRRTICQVFRYFIDGIRNINFAST